MGEVNQLAVRSHLAKLNANWRYFDDIEAGRILFATEGEREFVAQATSDLYERAEHWLEEHGYPWECLRYNHITKQFHLPEIFSRS